MSPSPPPSPTSTESPRRPFRFDDLWRLDRLGRPVPSPDGKRVALPVTRVTWPDDGEKDRDGKDEPADGGKAGGNGDSEPENQNRTDLWLVELDRPRTARRLTWDGASQPAWSPCGAWLYFTRQRAMPADQLPDARSDLPRQLWRLPMDGPGEAERLTTMPTAVSSPKPLADGRHVAFLADSWADLGSPHDLGALAKRVKEEKDDPVQARITDRRLVRYWDEYRTDGRVPHVWVLDLPSGEVRDLMAGVGGLLHFMDFRWDLRPDGRQLAFSRNATEPPWQDVRMEIALVDVDLEALFPGAASESAASESTAPESTAPESTAPESTAPRRAPFADEAVWDNVPTYLHDGRLAFLRNLRPENSADFSRLVLWEGEAEGATVRDLLPGWDGDPGVPEPRPDAAELIFLAHERGRQRLFAVSADAASAVVVSADAARADKTNSAASGPQRLESWDSGSVVAAKPVAGGGVVCLHQGFRHPSELWHLPDSADQAPGSPHRLGDWNEGRLGEIDFGPSGDDARAEPESVIFPVPVVARSEESESGESGESSAPAETEAQMFVLHPPGFDPAKKYPLVLLLHGGPHSAWLDSFHMRWNASLFAAAGRIVAALNPHGSTGFGQAYAESIVGRHADQPFADAMAAVDRLLERGTVDEARMAVAGGSYGGFLTSWVIGHTDRFAAAVCHAGVYDLMAQFASDYTWSRGRNYGAEPWEDPALIDHQSPSRAAGAFTTPTLVLHGEKDYRVPVTQGINLFQVLQGKGVPSKLVVFPKENHWILKPRAARLWWREIDDWLDRWIGRGPS